MFKQIPFGAGNYYIDESGNVMNKNTGRILRPGDTKKYLMVRLSYGKMTKMFLVHRLVAQAFLPNPNNLPVVMHKDNNKYNNHVSNLKWGTYSENTLQACQDGLVHPPYEYNKLTWILFNPDCPVYI